MYRFQRLAVVAVLAAASLVLDAAPSHAHGTEVCAGTGAITVAAPGLRFVGSSAALAFAFSIATGGCTNGHPAVVNGSFDASASCAFATGSGTWFSGPLLPNHGFTVVLLSPNLHFFGDVTGTLTIMVDVFAGQSCMSGASQFIIVGGSVTLT